MSSSLLIAGFDVLAPGSQVQLLSGFDRSAPAPSVAEIQSTVLDGAVVSGLASGNRQPQFTLLVRGTSRLNLAAVTNQILQAVDQQTWTMTFTPDGGLPVTYDCFRATTAISSTLLEDAQLTQELTIKCEALPYGRSSAAQAFTMTSPPPVVVDNYDTKPTITPTSPYNYSTNATVISTPTYSGSAALQFLLPSGAGPAITVARTGLSVAVANGISSVTLAVLPHIYSSFWVTSQHWSLTVTVGGTPYTATAIAAPNPSAWSQVTFNFATVVPAGTLTAYSLVIPPITTNGTGYTVDIDYLVAYPASGARATSTWGTEYLLPMVVGSARTPVNLLLTPPSGTFAQMCLHAPPSNTPDSQCLLSINDAVPPGAVTTPSGRRYNGTYSVWVSFKAAASLTTGNTITLTVSQSGATSVVLTHVVTLDEHNQGTLHMLLYFGEVALPLVGIPAQNSQSITFTVSATGLAGTDLIGDVLVLDTRGQTVLTDIHTPASEAVWVNEPSPGAAFGAIYSSPSTGTLSDAVSITSDVVTGAPMWLYPPGNSRLVVWCNTLAPTAALTYYPRWLQEATT